MLIVMIGWVLGCAIAGPAPGGAAPKASEFVVELGDRSSEVTHEPADYAAALDAGLARFKAGKEAHGGSYWYYRSHGSWTGAYDEVLVVFEGGKPQRRAWQRGRDGEKGPSERWVEEGKDVGSHKEGEKALSMEEMYASCRGIVGLHDSPVGKFRTLLATRKADGALVSCSSAPEMCVDDCSTSYGPDLFGFGPIPKYLLEKFKLN